MASSLQKTVYSALQAAFPAAAAVVTFDGVAVAALCPGAADVFRTSDEGALAGTETEVSFASADEPRALRPGDVFTLTDAAGLSHACRASSVDRTGGITYVKAEPQFA